MKVKGKISNTKTVGTLKFNFKCSECGEKTKAELQDIEIKQGELEECFICCDKDKCYAEFYVWATVQGEQVTVELQFYE